MAKPTIGQRVYEELDRIRRSHGGVLLPNDVVAAAKSTKSPLHGQFTWDDSRAAHEYRLEQARHLIRVAVTILEPTGDREVRAFVSLRNDRANVGGGYRAIVDVLSSDKLRAQMLAEARADMLAFQVKYSSLEELAGVFKAIEAALAAKSAKGFAGAMKRVLARI